MKIMCNVVGITFRNNTPEFESLRPDGVVRLVRNPYISEDKPESSDPLACEIWYGQTMVGYVKKNSYAQEFLADHPEIVDGWITGYSYAEKVGDDLKFNNDHVGRLSSLSYDIICGDDAVTLDEDNNYVINCVKYTRLSKVLNHFNPDPDNPGLDRWKIDHDSYDDYMLDLNTRARAGTAMHKAIEDYLRDGTQSDLIPPGFFNFMKKFDVFPDGMELLLRNDEHMIAGRCDLKAVVNDGPKKARVQKVVAIDWKSAKKPTKKHAIQNSWYGTEMGVDEAWVVAFGGTTKQGFSVMKIGTDKMHRLHEVVCLTKRAADLLNAK